MKDVGDLTAYDPTAYDRPSVAVDCVAIGIVDGQPAVLLTRRDQPPFAGHWALPGGFVAIDESLEAAAVRVLRGKAKIGAMPVEQVHSFGAVDRDPRMRIIAVAYRALLSPVRIRALQLDVDQCLARIGSDGSLYCDGRRIALAFDHDAIVAHTLAQLRSTIDDAAFALAPQRFTLRELQQVHEAVLGQSLNKPAFRRRMLERGTLRGTGEFEGGRAFRPAELYVQLPKD